jgi:hypothetical protein
MKAKKSVSMLVRKPGAPKFLKTSGEWTRRTEAACNFPNVLNLVHTCLARGLGEVELVVHFQGDLGARCYALSLD